jgi:hypothetical protein
VTGFARKILNLARNSVKAELYQALHWGMV